MHCNIIIRYKITKYTVYKLIFQFKISSTCFGIVRSRTKATEFFSTCFETEGSFSERRLYLQYAIVRFIF